MNARTMRRLAADHAALHSQPLPPNYFFPPGADENDNLTQLDIMLAGPTHTPYTAGAWRLHLTIPNTYPQHPPTAHFRTPIFHPNVEPQTGGVCVETLKRDWDAKLTLRDVLLTISCLLIQPNPDSALNADAGALIREDYASFERRAVLMTGIHASIPVSLQAAVEEAQMRGQETQADESELEEVPEMEIEERIQEPPARRRRTIANVRAAINQRRQAGSPEPARRRPPPPPAISTEQPFVFQAGSDDIFGLTPPREPIKPAESDEEMSDADQENGQLPPKPTTPKSATTPRRPHGAAIPLGELIMDDSSDSSPRPSPEYPPSPRKSPMKSPAKKRQRLTPDLPESSRAATLRGGPNLTPPNFTEQPLAPGSAFAASPSPRKARRALFDAVPEKVPLFKHATPRGKSLRTGGGGVFKLTPPPAGRQEAERERKRGELEKRLWKLCGGDIERWNRGEFAGEPFQVRGGRW